MESFFGKLARTLPRGIRVTSKAELKARIELYLTEVNEEPVLFKWRYKLDTVAGEPIPVCSYCLLCYLRIDQLGVVYRLEGLARRHLCVLSLEDISTCIPDRPTAFDSQCDCQNARPRYQDPHHTACCER